MVILMQNNWNAVSLTFCCLLFLGCSSDLTTSRQATGSPELSFGRERVIGTTAANPSTPFLRYSPDGRLFAVWTEDHDTPWPQEKAPAGHHGMGGDRGPSP